MTQDHVDHAAIAHDIARGTVSDLRDTGAMAISEAAEPLVLEDSDVDAISYLVNDLADQLDATLDDEEG